MYYKMLPSGQLKIVLSQHDLTALEINLKEDSLDSSDTRLAFFTLLSSVEEDIPFPKKRTTLLIELTPTKGGGCVALYTAILNNRQVLYPFTCMVFRDAATFFDAGIALFSTYSSRIYRSFGFCDDNQYYLIFNTLSEPTEMIRLLSEFGTLLQNSPLTLSFCQEHYTPIPLDHLLDHLYQAYVQTLEPPSSN